MSKYESQEFAEALKSYEIWRSTGVIDEQTKIELDGIKDDQAEIFDRYYKELEFGTGGLRGVLGAGTNRINIYTVRKATQGFADYINSIANAGHNKKTVQSADENQSAGQNRSASKNHSASVAIAYDSRNLSQVLAKSAAEVLAANGIKAYVYSELMPTPALSFAVRHYHCDAGIMITASHNPAKYNGYKAYDSEGCQLTLEAANAVTERINKLDIFKDIKYTPIDEALGNSIFYIPQEVSDAYLAAVLSESMTDAKINQKLKVVYTPLNGAGNKPVRKMLEMIGVSEVTIVKEQEMPDGDFPTCPFPNPEKAEALKVGIDLCKEMEAKGQTPDLLLATDPDCDRVGIAVYHKGTYVLLTGNEVGVLLLDFICRSRIKNGTMPQNPIAVKTIVTTAMTDAVAKEYGVEVINVLTGFKFIGEQIKLLEDKQEDERFIFGYEESYGYLSKGYVRDKDAVNGAMLICELAATLKAENKTLVDALYELYEKHGYYKNHLLDFYFEGAHGMSQMAKIIKNFRENPPKAAAGRNVTCFTDYMLPEKTGLPPADVLEFQLEDGSCFIIRPSGTEPKIKVYISAKGETKEKSDAIVDQLTKELQLA